MKGTFQRLRPGRIAGVILALVIFAMRMTARDLKLEEVGRFALPNHEFYDVQIEGNYLYAGAYMSGWYVIDVRNPAAPIAVLTNNLPTDKPILGMRVTANGFLITSLGNRANLYHLSNPALPTMINGSAGASDTYEGDAQLFRTSFYVPGGRGVTRYHEGVANSTPAFRGLIFDTHVDGFGDYLYAIGGGLFALRASGSSLIASSRDTVTFATGIRATGDTLLTTGPHGLLIYDISNPATPTFVNGGFASSGMIKLEVEGKLAYVASGTNGVQVIDFTDRMNLKRVGWFDTAGACNEVCVAGDYIYVADGANGILVLRQTASPVLRVESWPPSSLVVRSGGTMRLAVKATSSAPISYQWSASEALAETGPTFTLPNINRSHSGVYSVRVTDGTSTEVYQTTVRVIGNLQTVFMPSSIPPLLYVTDPNGVLDARYLILERSTNLTDWSAVLDAPFMSDPPGALNGVGNDPDARGVFYRVREGEEPFF